MEQEKVHFESGGYRLAGIIDLPQRLPAPAVVLCHGYTNTKDDCPLFGDATKKLLENNIIVFRFDQYGSGNSPGRFKDKLMSILMQNANDALNFIAQDKRVKAEEIGMLGISTGGTLLTLMGDNYRLKASVMISPSFNLVREFARDKETLDEKTGYADLACDPQTKKPATGKTKGELLISKKFFEELPELNEIAKRVLPQMKNVMVLFGADDQLVSPLCGQEIINLVRKPRELHLIDGAGHNCKRKSEIAVNLAAGWLVKFLR